MQADDAEALEAALRPLRALQVRRTAPRPRLLSLVDCCALLCLLTGAGTTLLLSKAQHCCACRPVLALLVLSTAPCRAVAALTAARLLHRCALASSLHDCCIAAAQVQVALSTEPCIAAVSSAAVLLLPRRFW